ncbi:nickel-dependent lactate racemase [Candidatus Cloacimonadota bacterium]
MNINIAYGEKSEELEISSSNLAVISLPHSKQAAAQLDIITNAANYPVDSESLKSFLQDCRKLLVIVNDGARATPSASVMHYLSSFWKQMNVKFIVATGTHRCSSELELRRIFGDLYDSIKTEIHIHDAENDPMLDLGITSYGTPVKFNRIISEVEKIININSIEPHYFAGFSGGRKSFQPGIASYQTIEKNHALAMHPDSQLLKLQGNPVHDDMMEAVEMIDKAIFSFNLVLDSENRITAASAGNWRSSFYSAVEQSKQTFLKNCPSQADIVVALVKPPLDDDLYQAHKGMENCRKVLKKDGIMILVAPCSNGIGKDQFYQLLSSCQTPEEVFSRISSSYKLGYHKAAKMAAFIKDHQLWMVTELDESRLNTIGIRKFDSVQAAIDNAVSIKGKDCDVILNLDAGVMVPSYKKNNISVK